MPESIPPNPARSIDERAEAEVDKHRDKQNSSHPVAKTMLATSVAAGPGPPLSWATVVTMNGASRLDAGGLRLNSRCALGSKLEYVVPQEHGVIDMDMIIHLERELAAKRIFCTLIREVCDGLWSRRSYFSGDEAAFMA
ncbi:hypothetical protein U1Q18_031286 [Sarracenia purpurea var. burkii]